MKLTISAELSTFTPESFYSYVKSLYRTTIDNKTSKVVPRISLNFTKAGKCIIKLTGEKEITSDELALLATEYVKTPEFLMELFTKRKIKVIDSLTKEPLNVSVRKSRSKKRAQEDAPAFERPIWEALL